MKKVPASEDTIVLLHFKKQQRRKRQPRRELQARDERLFLILLPWNKFLFHLHQTITIQIIRAQRLSQRLQHDLSIRNLQEIHQRHLS